MEQTPPIPAGPSRILYCHCAYAQVVPKAVKEEVLRRLLDSNVAFDSVADLCELSAKRDPMLRQLNDAGPVKIAACYPRAVRWLFAAADVKLNDQAQVLNMRTETADAIADSLLQSHTPAGGSQ